MQVWHIKLFGNLAVSRGGDSFSRFSTRKTGALLAYLAYHRGQNHSRELLCHMLWPDDSPEASRARLRVALSSLRRQLEPPGVSAGSVIVAEGHEHIRLASETFTTDVQEVSRALKLLQTTDYRTTEEQIDAAQVIVSHFNEPLLAGMYDDWVITERDHLALTASQHLSMLASQLPAPTGIELAQHAAHLDPLSETPLLTLLPLLARNGQYSLAQRTFRDFERRWEKAIGTAPTPKLQQLVAALPQGSGMFAPTATVPAPTAPKTALPQDSPPLTVPATQPPPTKRLPLYLTRFFGREEERGRVCDALHASRLVTLTGPGGIGKTRLCVEVARVWNGPCWFVPLTELEKADLLPATICDALGNFLKAKPASDTPDAFLQQAADALAAFPSETLLVLDNLEQIADAAGSLILALLEKVSNLRLLVTSRLRLHLPGEAEYFLGPLPLPKEDPVPERVDLDDHLMQAVSVPSVALFLDRARATRPDFQITTRNQKDVLAICQILEGVPLAIELVAARGGSLVPAQMREMLITQGGLSIVDRRARDGDRHRSLYAAIAWSYRLLPLDLQRFFARLSVFRGGFTVEAAAAVCETSLSGASEALARLRAHSLVIGIADALEMRFAFLESLRSFAGEQLSDGEQADLRHRHCDWFIHLGEQSHTAIPGPAQGTWMERLDTDRDNLRAALQYALDEDLRRAVQLSGAIWMYWHLRGQPSEGRLWLERVLTCAADLPESDDKALLFQKARALHGAGTLAWIQGDGERAAARLRESLHLRREIDDRVGITGTLNNLGLLSWSRQELEAAQRFLEESLALRREQGSTKAALASSLHNLGTINWERGEYAAARALAEEALVLCREAGDHIGEGHALNNLGNVALSLGNFAEAENWYTQSLVLKRPLGYTPGIAATLSNVGITALYQDKFTDAKIHLEESLRLYRDINQPDGIAMQLRNLGQVAIGLGDFPHATALFIEGLTLRRASDTPQDIAMHLEGFVLLRAATGNSDTAAHILGASETCRARFSTPLHPSERVALDKAIAQLQTDLGDTAFETARLSGANLTPDEAASLALGNSL